MIDLRIWRAALLVAPVVIVIAMFSLRSLPGALQSALPPDAFDAQAAATLAGDLAEAHPEPRPGSDQDEALGRLVQDRFAQIPSVEVSEQTFSASYGGEDVELRNLIAVLPGQSERQIAVLAHRDAAAGSGAASSTAATAALLELASALSGTIHQKTLVFVSTDGGEIGALGARRFAEDYSEADLLDAVIVLSQPASPDPSPPMVVPWSTGTESGGIQLERTANAIVSDQVGRPAGDIGPLAELFRLALPSGLGEQGPLVASGLDAVRLSSAGERPLPPDRDTTDGIEGDTIERFGRSALSLLLAIDGAPGSLEHGPSAYVGLAGNVLPGWTLSLLALSLLLAALAPAAAGLARAANHPTEAARAIGWALLRAVPFAVAAVVLYAFSLIGVIRDPAFPFDPPAEEVGRGGTIATVVAILAFAAAAFLLRPLLPPSGRLAATAPAAALLLAALAAIGVWVVNPYLGLLAGVGVQAWVAAAATDRGRLAAAGLIALGLIPALALLIDLAGRFGTGAGVLGDILLMFSDDQLSDRLVVCAAVLGGAALAIVASRGPAPSPETPQLKLRALVERGRELERRRTAARANRRRGPLARRRERRGERERQRRERAERVREELEQGVSPDADRKWTADEPEAEIVDREYDRSENEPGTGAAEAPADADEATTSRDPGPAEAGDHRDEPDGGPDQDEPARDPRLWSKPEASTSAPSRPCRAAPWPARTAPT